MIHVAKYPTHYYGKTVTVTFYPYRTKRVVTDVRVDRKHMKGLEEFLALLFGCRSDNHVCFTVEACGHTTAFMFSDCTCYIGDEPDSLQDGDSPLWGEEPVTYTIKASRD